MCFWLKFKISLIIIWIFALKVVKSWCFWISVFYCNKLFLCKKPTDVKVGIFPSRVAINPDTKFSFFCLLYVIARLLPLLVRQPKFYYLQEDQTQVARRRAVPKAKKSILVVMDGWKLAFALLLPKHNFKSPWGEGGRAIYGYTVVP